MEPELGQSPQEKNTPDKPKQDFLSASIIVGCLIIALSIMFVGQNLAKILVSSQNFSSSLLVNTQQPVLNLKDRTGQPTLGNPNAKITMVEFADFQCPYCQAFFRDTFPEIKAKYIDIGKVKFIFRQLPLAIHQNAQAAAVASECANNQNRFYDYYDMVFKNAQPSGAGLAAANLKQYAKALGLDSSKFNQCLDNNETLPQITEDVNAAIAAQVAGTPTFFVNGQKVVGAQGFSVFQQILQ